MKKDESQLPRCISQCGGDKAWAWIESQISAIDDISDNMSHLDVALAVAQRKLGTTALTEPGLQHWNCADAGRVLMLSRASCVLGIDIVARAYRLGDQCEKEAILKGLSRLDASGHLMELAVDACRTNIESMMRAISLFNIYPGRFFSEHAFNQMVLKCLFMGLDISHVLGLETRTNPSLSRMCFDYCQERVAAGRDFPASLWLGICLQDVPASQALYIEYLMNGSDEHRHNILYSLKKSTVIDVSIIDALKTRLQTEQDSGFRQLMTGLIH